MVRTKSKEDFQFAAQAKKGIKAGDYGDPFGYEYSNSWHTISAGKCGVLTT